MRANVSSWLSAFVLGFCACSGERSGALVGEGTPATGAGTAGQGVGAAAGTQVAQAGNPSGASGTGSASGVAGQAGSVSNPGRMMTAGASATSPASGSAGTSGSAAGGAGVAASGGGATAGAGGTGTVTPTACNGKPVPPRAVASAGPFEIGPAAAGLPPYFPTEAWQMKPPEMLGLDPQKLEKAIAHTVSGTNTQAVLVVRHGYLAAERYFGGYTANTRSESWSMAKSFSSILIGIAIGEGLIKSVDEKLCMYYPNDWDCNDANDPRSRITIAHAMNVMTGLRWNEDWRSSATGVNDAVVGVLDMLGTVLAREAVEEPGTRMRYSTGDPALLSGVLQKATGMTAFEYARKVLFGPIGIPGVQWNTDLQGRTTTFAGLQGTAQEYAKFGYLLLNRGQWDGKQVVPADWVDFTTRGKAPCDDWYRYLWHQNPPIRLGEKDPACPDLYCPPIELADLPPEIFFAEGVAGQYIFVIPNADMVVVRLATDGGGVESWDEYARDFLRLMLDAVQ